MKTTPILSIIVPSYNIEKYVDECLPTFVDEKLIGKIKVILIDDGATDNTSLKIQPFVEKYPKLFAFIHKENGGHGSVINYGVHKIVDTKYFKVIDGDDWVDSNSLLALANYLYETDDDLVVSSCVFFYPQKQEIKYPIDKTLDYKEKTTYDDSILDHLNISIHSATFKRSLFIEHNITLTEKVFYDDNQFVCYPLFFVRKISFINDVVYYYRLGNFGQSVSINGIKKHFFDIENVRKHALDFYDKNKSSITQHQDRAICKILASSLCSFYPIIVYYSDNKLARKECRALKNVLKKYDLIYWYVKQRKFNKALLLFKFYFLGYFRKKVLF